MDINTKIRKSKVAYFKPCRNKDKMHTHTKTGSSLRNIFSQASIFDLGRSAVKWIY